MAQTLHDLAGILLKSVPTIILLLLLHFYLKAMLFKPLEKLRVERDALTTGARTAARKSLDQAEQKTQEFETKMREARAEVYREQEETRKTWLADQANQLAFARDSSARTIQNAKEQMAAEVATARASLSDQAGALADRITASILSERPVHSEQRSAV